MSELEIKQAWVFPGVGVKPCGQETVLFREFSVIFQEFFSETSRISGRNLTWLRETTETEFPAGLDEQLASFSFACAMVEMLRVAGRTPDILAGNSFGVYPAVWAAGALDFAACIGILTRAYQHMEAAARVWPASLCAIVGLAAAENQAIIAGAGLNSVVRINSNNHTCHIYCGLQAEITDFAAACQSAGALNAAILPMALPYHHPKFTAGVSAIFADEVQALDWRQPLVPVLSTLDFQVLDNAASLAEYVSRQIFQPINWAESVSGLYRLGITQVYECGVGISLTQNARFIDGAAHWHNCRTLSRKLASHG